MTIGISKERLEEILSSNGNIAVNIKYLLSQCTELNPWKPIDQNTPKHRELLLWHEPSEQQIIAYSNHPNCTKWQELPGDPE